MRKRCLSLAVILFSLQITGCGGINLTTQEKNVIAEYIAGILLKHDKTYEPTLQYNLKEENTEQPAKEETKDKEEIEEKDNQSETDNNSSKKPSKNTEGKEEYTISSVYNKSLNVSSAGYSFYQRYPKKVDAILPVEASSGNTICVVRLKVKNTSSSSKKIDFLMDNYSYQLKVGSNKTYNAIQSVLVDDIQYLETTLGAGKSKEAMVAFEIPKKLKNKKLNLLITKDSKTANIVLH